MTVTVQKLLKKQKHITQKLRRRDGSSIESLVSQFEYITESLRNEWIAICQQRDSARKEARSLRHAYEQLEKETKLLTKILPKPKRCPFCKNKLNIK